MTGEVGKVGSGATQEKSNTVDGLREFFSLFNSSTDSIVELKKNSKKFLGLIKILEKQVFVKEKLIAKIKKLLVVRDDLQAQLKKINKEKRLVKKELTLQLKNNEELQKLLAKAKENSRNISFVEPKVKAEVSEREISVEPVVKKRRGRPPGSKGKKFLKVAQGEETVKLESEKPLIPVINGQEPTKAEIIGAKDLAGLEEPVDDLLAHRRVFFKKDDDRFLRPGQLENGKKGPEACIFDALLAINILSSTRSLKDKKALIEMRTINVGGKHENTYLEFPFGSGKYVYSFPVFKLFCERNKEKHGLKHYTFDDYKKDLVNINPKLKDFYPCNPESVYGKDCFETTLTKPKQKLNSQLIGRFS